MPAETIASASDVLRLLRSRGHTLATAESLTGGLIVATLTRIPGASAVVRGGLAAYATDVKRDVLGVDPDVIATYGVVSPETAMSMARRAVALFDSTWAVAVTGVAGPDRQEERAVGTVFVGVAGPAMGASAYDDLPAGAEQFALSGDRDDIRAGTVSVALRMLRNWVERDAGKISAV